VAVIDGRKQTDLAKPGALMVHVDVVLSDILMSIGGNVTTQDQSQERHDEV
jgi:hypothetical protein